MQEVDIQKTSGKVRTFYAFKVFEGVDKIYISTKPKVKCFPDELSEYVMRGIVVNLEPTREKCTTPKIGNIYSTIKGIHFVCADFHLTQCNE